METKTNVKFQSQLFQKINGEDEETNPGIFGKQLAEWIYKNIGRYGENATEVIAEDFGWLVMLKSDQLRSWIACCSSDEIEDEWLCSICAERTLRSLFGKADKGKRVERIRASLDKLLKEENQITRIEWF